MGAHAWGPPAAASKGLGSWLISGLRLYSSMEVWSWCTSWSRHVTRPAARVLCRVACVCVAARTYRTFQITRTSARILGVRK